MRIQELGEKILQYRGWNLDRFAIRELGRIWLEFKWPIFRKYFGRSPSIKIPVFLCASENEILPFAAVFKSRFGVDILEFGIEAILNNRTPSGEKLGKYLRKKVRPESQTDFSQSWEEFLRFVVAKGFVKITVNPYELLAISECTTGWHSCHSIHSRGDVCYFEANLVYATDAHTVLAYFYSSPEPVFAGLPAKVWRQLFYWDDENKILIASRQYPSERNLIANFVTRKMCEIFFGEEVSEIEPKIKISVPRDEDLFPEVPEFNPYIDSGYFRCYGHTEKTVRLRFVSPILKTRLCEEIAMANALRCANCGCALLGQDAYRGLDGEDYCEACFLDLFTYCDACGDLIWSNSAYISVNDRTYCALCAERWLVTCEHCGYYVEEPDAIRVVLEDAYGVEYICRDCFDRNQDEFFECPHCREVYIRRGVNFCMNCRSNLEVKNEA